MLRRLHRWVGVAAALFIISVASTGVVLQIQHFEKEEKESSAKKSSSFSLDTSLGEISSKLPLAQAAAKAKIGPAPLDRIEIEFNGKIPHFVLHTMGDPKRKITFDVNSGVIEKVEEDEESWIMRLHSGELFGDAGVVMGAFGGLAWLFLVITGLIIYWKMRKGPKKGWRKIFWVFLFLVLCPKSSMAGSPFLTDDPGFAPKGWEIKTESIYQHDKQQDVLAAPVIDINYTIVEHFKLNLTIAEKTLFRDDIEGEGTEEEPLPDTSTQSGFADMDFKYKWRFLDEKPGKWWPALSMAPNITFPTASRRRGLGDGLWRLRLPIQIGKTFGKAYTYAEFGHQFVFDKAASDQFVYGYAVQYQLTSKFNIGAEINGSIPYELTRTHTMIGNVGAVYTFNEHWQLQGSVGKSLRGGANSPELLTQIFVQCNF